MLRGGLMVLETLCGSVKESIEEDGYYNLCFWGENNMTIEEIARASLIRNGQMRVSTVGRVRALGYEPYATDPWPHLEVRFEAEPTDDELEALVRAFEEPIPNPDPKE